MEVAKEEYQKRTSELIASQTDENILGFETESGRRIHHDKNNQVRLNTMLKPDDGEEYYHDNYIRDFPD